MEDVAAIKIKDRVRGEYALLTWGRVYDSVDPEQLLVAVRRLLPILGFASVDEVTVCYDLGEVSKYRYFYEALLSFAGKIATESYQDAGWLRAQRNDEALLRSVYLIGPSPS